MSNIGSLLAGDEDAPAAKPPRPKRTETSAPGLKATPQAKPSVKEEMWVIQLEENENIPPTGQFFGINGRSFILRAGEQARVPVGIVNVLNDAIVSVPNVDPVTMQVNGYRDKLRFPYRVVSRDV